MKVAFPYKAEIGNISQKLLNGLDSVVSSIQQGYSEADRYHAVEGYRVKNRETLVDNWVDVPWVSGHFSASGTMVWTVESTDHISRRYALGPGNTMDYAWRLDTTTLATAASNEVRIRLPIGYIVGGPFNLGLFFGSGQIINGGYNGVCLVTAVSGANYVSVYRPDTANYTLEANVVYIRGQIRLEVATT